jgi:multiple sugar transport system substrate-binding protein
MEQNSIDFSVCLTSEQNTTPFEKVLESFNNSLHGRARAVVSVVLWNNSTQELTSMALHSRGADVSQIGAPLINDLFTMNALKPFLAHEINALGGKDIFTPVAWEGLAKTSEGQVWSIPWLADPRALLYWKDMLEQAGVDERNAFVSFDAMEQTMQKLQRSGIKTPWVLDIGAKWQVIHSALSWLWGAGGEIVSSDHKTPLFHEKEALTGLQAYYRLYHYMPQQNQPMGLAEAHRLFREREAVATIGSLGTALELRTLPEGLKSKLGITFPPGPPYVGGSGLVVWRHSSQPDVAQKLIQFLVSKEVQLANADLFGFLPVTKEALEEPPFSTDPDCRSFTLASKQGKTFPLFPLAGLLEAQLETCLTTVWHELFVDPQLDISTSLSNKLSAIALRLEGWSQ